MLVWTELTFTVGLLFTLFGHHMFKFAAYLVEWAHLVVVVIMTVFDVFILMNIHMLSESPLKIKSFSKKPHISYSLQLHEILGVFHMSSFH